MWPIFLRKTGTSEQLLKYDNNKNPDKTLFSILEMFSGGGGVYFFSKYEPLNS